MSRMSIAIPEPTAAATHRRITDVGAVGMVRLEGLQLWWLSSDHQNPHLEVLQGIINLSNSLQLLTRHYRAICDKFPDICSFVMTRKRVVSRSVRCIPDSLKSAYTHGFVPV